MEHNIRNVIAVHGGGGTVMMQHAIYGLQKLFYQSDAADTTFCAYYILEGTCIY